jgi:1-acyl-sn-glycerol-3-phosphate acyltransferase
VSGVPAGTPGYRVRPLYPRRPWQVVPGVRLFSFYTFAVVGLNVLLRILTHIEIVGREHIPKSGALVVVANHTHFIDPPVVGATLGRKVLLMAKQELFRAPLVGWMVGHYDAFPVRRGEADRQAMRWALEALQLGQAIGMFPEGTRSRTGEMQPAFPGAALIALRSGAPVLPVGIDGTDRVFRQLRHLRRPTVRVVYGPPFQLSLEDRAQSTDEMMRRVADLLPEWRRGPYAR